jgi:hypothetical protein
MANDSQMATRFPGVLLRLPAQAVEAYITLGVIGLSAQERFSLKTATEFFVSQAAHLSDAVDNARSLFSPILAFPHLRNHWRTH